MKKWITVICGALLDALSQSKYRTEKKPDGVKEQELLGGKIRIRKVHNHGFALNMLSGEDRIVKGGSLAAGILLLGYYIKLLFQRREHGNLRRCL